jgi:predicted enzyme related to lactoylglutathione lyase
MNGTGMADERRFDRSAEDLGNIINFGHLNLTVPDQMQATAFYVTGLGLTRDPYMSTGTNNMWVNVGRSQFHLPTAKTAQICRGTIGLVVPDLDALERRLGAAAKELGGTQFRFERRSDTVTATCPWGNRFTVHGPDAARFGPFLTAFAYLDFDVPAGTVPGIARFYREILDATSDVIAGDSPAACVQVGEKQVFRFREAASVPAFDGHHVQIYITNFSGPYNRLAKRGLISQESNQHQYRFLNIVDPASGDVLYVLDHEVRSATHPMFARPLVNRNAGLASNYAQGYEDQAWAAR